MKTKHHSSVMEGFVRCSKALRNRALHTIITMVIIQTEKKAITKINLEAM